MGLGDLPNNCFLGDDTREWPGWEEGSGDQTSVGDSPTPVDPPSPAQPQRHHLVLRLGEAQRPALEGRHEGRRTPQPLPTP